MRFEKYYSSPYVRSDYLTILPFFGYKYKTVNEKRSHTYGGEIKVTHEYGNTFKVEKTPERGSEYTIEQYSYERSSIQSPEKLEIESRFLEALSKIKIQHFRLSIFSTPVLQVKRIPRFRLPSLFASPISLLQTPYLEPTLQSYHETRGAETIFTDFQKIIGKIFLAFSLLIIICHIGGPLENTIPLTFWHSQKIQLISAAVFAVTGSLFWFLSRAIARRFSKIPFYQTSRKYQEKLKSCYYRRMRYLYGRKMGNILKEYSILKENNQHKLQ